MIFVYLYLPSFSSFFYEILKFFALVKQFIFNRNLLDLCLESFKNLFTVKNKVMCAKIKNKNLSWNKKKPKLKTHYKIIFLNLDWKACVFSSTSHEYLYTDSPKFIVNPISALRCIVFCIPVYLPAFTRIDTHY